MSFGVGIFRAESRSERIDVFKSHREAFALELTAYGESHFLAEEIARIVHASVVVKRNLVKRQRGCLEHFACAFAVAVGENGRVNVYEAVVLQIGVNCHCGNAAHAEHRLEQIGSGTQIRLLAQKFAGVAFGLNGEFVGSVTEKSNLFRLDFKSLSFCFGLNYFTFYFDCRAVFKLGHFVEIFGKLLRIHHLNVLEAGPVLKIYKAEVFLFSMVSYPAGKRDVFIHEFRCMFV